MRVSHTARVLATLAWVAASALRAQAGTSSDSTVHASKARRVDVVRRDSTTGYAYTRPPPFHAILDVPAALGASGREAVRAKYIPMWIAVGASTAVLIAADEQVLAATRRVAQRVDLPPNHPSANLRLGPFKQPFPTTLGSGLYFLGDGMMSVFVAGGFAIHGTLADDQRARRTASEVIESLLAAGTVTQVLKHVAGRQTPSEATAPRGRWRPFPKLSDYSANVPAYDAFPSGHLASTMSTLTVLALNYPEHRYIWPVGSVIAGVLAFTMVNNGVHWASDYPLGLAIGGIVGKTVVERGRKLVPLAPETPGAPVTQRARLNWTPVIAPDIVGVRVAW
jgi:membrane-associated phospholipid phosphatase